jgi:hypothetical protein
MSDNADARMLAHNTHTLLDGQLVTMSVNADAQMD